MPKINLGKVVGDKGDSFTYEDFTPEQLNGITPKIFKGNVTTLNPDQNATVDIRNDGLNNYIDFGIPRGKNGSEIKNIYAENVSMADGNTLESTMTNIITPTFDDSTQAYETLTTANAAAETTSNKIKSGENIFTTLSNMKKSFSAIVQGLKILGTNVGNIRGITSDLNSESDYIAASSKAVSILNGNLNYSRFRIDNSAITVEEETESVLPIKTVITNADSENYEVNEDGTITINKAGIYLAVAKVHGSFRTGLLVISESPWPACIIQVILAMAVTIAYNSRNVYLVPFVLLARHSLS